MPEPTDLERALRAVQPAVRLVRARHLARIRREVGGLGDPLPLWTPPAQAPDLEPFDGSAVLLLPLPDDVRPRRHGPELLRVYWRWLVQADVFRQLDPLTNAETADQLAALGSDAAAEVRCVLTADHLIAHDASPRDVYRAFTAVAVDALCFEPERFGRLFPLLAKDTLVHQKLSAAVDAAAVMKRLQPAGSAPALEQQTPSARSIGGFVRDVSAAVGLSLRRGNSVRAAVTLARAGDNDAVRALRDGLVADLARVLGWDRATTDTWDAALRLLLKHARDADWSRAVRCLYDLQRIVADATDEPAELTPYRWLVSLGRRPLRRPTPHAGPVRVLRHLTTARDHLRRSHLPHAERSKLDELLEHAQHHTELRVRAECEPAVREAITAAGLMPASLDERVALDATAAELLDRVAERGFVRFADLRDAVARNALKLPDLSGPGEWWRGDALLRADRRLGESLTGVYRPAEVYLRVIHRVIAAAFGTPAGRWLSLWVLLPFGGGLMAVEFAKYLALELKHLWGWVRGLFPADEPVVPDPLAEYLAQFDDPPAPHHGGLSLDPVSVGVAVGLGILFLVLIHHVGFRRRFFAVVGAVGRFVFVTLPAAMWDAPPIKAVRTNSIIWAVGREVGMPLVVAAMVAGGLAVAGAGWSRLVIWATAAFVVTLAATLTPLGRRLEEETAEAASDGWRIVRHGLVPGLVATVVDLFRVVADRVERGLYVVDEWLRFRDRDARPTVALKAVAAAVWQPLAYLLRFAFYLLIEPQANPVKHFPVVTVSHKLLLPAVPSLSGLFGLSVGTTTGLVSLVPGVFGFIAWELKESWRLYAANTPPEPSPLPVGHHGETVRGLLVPGFHRGTVPKLFAKLRRAADHEKAERVEHQLHEVEHSVARFADRYLVARLRIDVAWAGMKPEAGPVRLGTRTVETTLAAPGFGEGLMRVVFANTDGEVTARVEPSDWQSRLTPEQSSSLQAALDTFRKLGAAPT